MSLSEDGELLSYFPNKKKSKDLDAEDDLGVDSESDDLFLLAEEEGEEDSPEGKSLWDSDESMDIEDDLLSKTDPETKRILDLRDIESADHEVIDDPVHVYLREIGKVQLLPDAVAPTLVHVLRSVENITQTIERPSASLTVAFTVTDVEALGCCGV